MSHPEYLDFSFENTPRVTLIDKICRKKRRHFTPTTRDQNYMLYN